MRTFAVLLASLTLGCATGQITQADLDDEQRCHAILADATARDGRKGLCREMLAELEQKRTALRASEAHAQYERDCYVALEDPNASPQVRGACRQYFAQQNTAAGADADRRARIAGAILGVKAAADSFNAQNRAVTTKCHTTTYGIPETTCVSQ